MSAKRHRDNAIVEVTKEFVFEAAHQLLGYLGLCANLHGHSYKLQVTVKGRMDAQGIVLDFAALKTLVNVTTLNKWDHAYLNDIMTCNPTAENMVVIIFEAVRDFLQDNHSEVEVCSVKLWETANSYAEYKGERQV